jgi:GxxExxY protein
MDTDPTRAAAAATSRLRRGELTDVVIGVFFDVYNELGAGFIESVYAGAMELALRQAGLDARREAPLPVEFRGQQVGFFRPDFIVGGAVILELKVARSLHEGHDAQLLNYLKATGIEIGLLLNFGQTPKVRRLILDARARHIRADP